MDYLDEGPLGEPVPRVAVNTKGPAEPPAPTLVWIYRSSSGTLRTAPVAAEVTRAA